MRPVMLIRLGVFLILLANVFVGSYMRGREFPWEYLLLMTPAVGLILFGCIWVERCWEQYDANLPASQVLHKATPIKTASPPDPKPTEPTHFKEYE